MADSLAGHDDDLAALFGAALVFAALYTYRPSVIERETRLDPRTLRNKRDRGITFSHEEADAIVAFLTKHTGRSCTTFPRIGARGLETICTQAGLW